MSIIAGCLLIASPSLARVLDVRIISTNGLPQISVMSRSVSREEMNALLGKIAALDKDQLVYVIVDNKVPAASLVEIIHDIQIAGLHNLVLMSPAKRDGKEGVYQITVDATKRKFGGCIAGVEFDSGFQESLKYSLNDMNEELETLGEDTTGSQPSTAPYSEPVERSPQW